jgi:hypothetical protein
VTDLNEKYLYVVLVCLSGQSNSIILGPTLNTAAMAVTPLFSERGESVGCSVFARMCYS